MCSYHDSYVFCSESLKNALSQKCEFTNLKEQLPEESFQCHAMLSFHQPFLFDFHRAVGRVFYFAACLFLNYSVANLLYLYTPDY